MTSCLRMWRLGSNLNLECGATLDILKNAKKAVKNAALNKIGSSRMLQAREMRAKVVRSKMPLGVGAKDEFIEILLR